MKVFLGGTCAKSKWREYIIPLLSCDVFNPVVKDWTPECQKIEEEEKLLCDYHLYVITPKMKGVFSIAEAVNDSIKLPHGHCVFCVTKEDDDIDFTKGEKKSLDAVENLIKKNGGKIVYNLQEVVEYLNECNYSKELLNELEQITLIQKKIEFVQEINETIKDDNGEPYFSRDFLLKKYLGMTDEELELNKKYKKLENEEGSKD